MVVDFGVLAIYFFRLVFVSERTSLARRQADDLGKTIADGDEPCSRN